MRPFCLSIVLALVVSVSFAQITPLAIPAPPRPPRPPAQCCVLHVYDKTGKVIGDFVGYDGRYGPAPLNGFVRYYVAGSDDVDLQFTPEAINSLQGPGGSTVLFTTPDCSGANVFVQLAWPTPRKRYAVVLPVGLGGTLGFAATNAWLFVSDHLPSRVSAGATVFHAQWGESGACSPYPAPGYTVAPGPFGGYWMHRVEDLYAKFSRPFYIDY